MNQGRDKKEALGMESNYHLQAFDEGKEPTVIWIEGGS